jgi:hypothetical protein
VQSYTNRALVEHTPDSASASTLPRPDVPLPEAFLRARWGDGIGLPGHIVAWTLEDERSHWFPATELDAAGQAITKLAETYNVYVGMALQDRAAALAEADARERAAAERAGRAPRQVRPEYVRGYSKTALTIAGFWYEVDIGGPDHVGAHKKGHLPRTIEEALEVVDGFPLRPGEIVFSGHGIQAHWPFPEPLVFETAEERERAQDLLWRFQQTLHAAMTARGWDPDATHDFARVLRPWGTVNRKPGLEPVPVRVLRRDDSIRYSPDDFEPYLLDPENIGAKGRAEPVALPDDLAPVDVQALPLPRRVRDVIETGRYVDAETHEDRAPSSSERTWHVVNAMMEFGLEDETIASVFLDPRYKIGERVRAKRGGGRAWIAAEIGRARAHQRRKAESESKAPEIQFTPKGDDGGEGDLVEQLRAEVARLRKRAIDQDDKIEELEARAEVQTNVIRRLQIEVREAKERTLGLQEAIANPNLSGNELKVGLTAIWYAQWKQERGDDRPKVSLAMIEERTGLSKNTASKILDRIGKAEDPPFQKIVTRDARIGEDGCPEWVTTIQVQPCHERIVDGFRALARIAPDKPKHGGSPAAAEARWRCKKCGDTPMIVEKVWSCTNCGDVVHREPLDHQVGDPEPALVSVVVPVKGHSLRDPGERNGHSGPLDLQLVASAAATNGNGHGNGLAVLEAPPWRCHCGAFERHGGRCLGCGEPVPPPEERP